MTVDHPQFGLMCEICYRGLTPDECATDEHGQKWDVCAGDCAWHAGIIEQAKESNNAPGRQVE